MYPAERTGRFVLTLALVYGALIIPWPGLADTYAQAYRYVCTGLFGSLGSVADVRFEPMDGNRRFDSRAVLSCRGFDGVRSTRNVPFHSRKTGYLPTALVVALMIATPLPWAVRLKRLIAGIGLVQVFIAVGVAMTLLYSLSDQRPAQHIKPVIDVAASTSRFFFFCYRMLVISPTLSFVVPVLIWLGLNLSDLIPTRRNPTDAPSATARRPTRRHRRTG